MKRFFFTPLLFLGLSILFSSCEKDVVGGKSYLEGHYVLQKAEISCKTESGETCSLVFSFEKKTPSVSINGLSVSDKLAGTSLAGLGEQVDEVFYKHYSGVLVHDYEYIFEKNGNASIKTDYSDKEFYSEKYKVDDGIIYFSGSGFDVPAFIIQSKTGTSLVLECTPAIISLISFGAYLSLGFSEIEKSVGYYIKK